jgi:putative FmdB family regulatory protein
MPRYDFECIECRATFEEELPRGSKDFPPCSACGSRKVERRIAPPPVIFKGQGFYRTDSKTLQPPESGESSGESRKGKKEPSETRTPEPPKKGEDKPKK